MDSSRVGIIIPAYNEEASIGKIVSAASTYGRIIVVDDGSLDNTGLVAVKNGAIVVRHEINHGYDSALNSGFVKASELGFDVVITMDADGQHKPELISEFIAWLEKGYDVVIGIRSRKERLAERIFAWYTKVRYGIEDPLCGMKAYSMKVYDKLGHFDSFNSTGTELAVFARKEGFMIFQFPFPINRRIGSPKFGNTIVGNVKILRSLIKSIVKYG